MSLSKLYISLFCLLQMVFSVKYAYAEDDQFLLRVKSEYSSKIFKKCKSWHFYYHPTATYEEALNACRNFHPIHGNIERLPYQNSSCRNLFPSSDVIANEFDRVDYEATLASWCDYGPYSSIGDTHSGACLRNIRLSTPPSRNEIREAQDNCDGVKLQVSENQRLCLVRFQSLRDQNIYLENAFGSFCASRPVQSNETNECLRTVLRSGGTLDPSRSFPPSGFGKSTPDHFTLALTACMDENKECRNDLGQYFNLQSRNDYIYLHEVCEKNERIENSCVQDFKSSWGLPWTVENKKRAIDLCKASNAALKTCFDGACDPFSAPLPDLFLN